MIDDLIQGESRTNGIAVREKRAVFENLTCKNKKNRIWHAGNKKR